MRECGDYSGAVKPVPDKLRKGDPVEVVVGEGGNERHWTYDGCEGFVEATNFTGERHMVEVYMPADRNKSVAANGRKVRKVFPMTCLRLRTATK